tara:strand:+ start:4160 stop:5230 length:1071 start_codon:yes stop_codon:yes gene_type:complete
MIEILIYGTIGHEVRAQDIARQFQQARGKEVLLRIHSEGGSVHEGNAIISAIRGHDKPVSAHIDGMAFSMAANIALTLRKRLSMPADAWIMFHEVSGGGGQEKDLERQLEQMRAMNDSTARALAEAMNIGEEEARARLEEEIWMSGEQAHAAGLVPNLTPAEALAAHVSQGDWKNAPENLQDTNSTKPNTTMINKIFRVFQSDSGSEPEVAMLEADEFASQEFVALQKDFDELKATHAAELVARDEKHALELEAKLAEQREELTASHAEEIEAKENEAREISAKHAEELQAAEESSEEKANAILAQAGHEEIETTDAEELSVVDQYKAMAPGHARKAFREENRVELEKEFGRGALV